MLFDMSYNESPTVAGNGCIALTFPKFEKVLVASVTYDQSTNVSGDVSGGIDISWNFGVASGTNNGVNIWPFVHNATGAGVVVRRAALTADLTGKKFVVIATGT